MIDINTIKEGDVVVCRNGGKLTTEELNQMGFREFWHKNGRTNVKWEHPFDIVDIIRKPEPKVEILYIGRGVFNWFLTDEKVIASYKITLADGVPSIEVNKR